MDEQRNCVFVARKEYTTHLVYWLYPEIYKGLKSIWEETKKTVDKREVYAAFQHKLTRVPKWNQDVIEREYKRILDEIRKKRDEPFSFEDLIKWIFVLNTQILAAVSMSRGDASRKIKVQVPKGEKFVHHCYKECARAFYENALLMEDRPNTIDRREQQRNMQKAYKLIITCIENTIRNMLPIESLLSNTMDENAEGEDATPPPMLFQQQYQVPPVQIPQEKPLTSFPTVSSFLQQPQQQDNIMTTPPPSNGSLQPSMNELGSIPLKMDNHVVEERREPEPEPRLFTQSRSPERKSEPFDPDSLFEPSELNDPLEKREEQPRPKPNFDWLKSRNEGDKPKLSDFNPFKETPVEEDNVKTIILTKPHGRRASLSGIQGITPVNRKEREDVASENSDNDNVRSNKDVGGEAFESNNAEVPVVRRSHVDGNMDLDVFSSNNELPIEKKEPDIDSSKQSVPSLENMDRENFFSDVE